MALHSTICSQGFIDVYQRDSEANPCECAKHTALPGCPNLWPGSQGARIQPAWVWEIHLNPGNTCAACAGGLPVMCYIHSGPGTFSLSHRWRRIHLISLCYLFLPFLVNSRGLVEELKEYQVGATRSSRGTPPGINVARTLAFSAMTNAPHLIGGRAPLSESRNNSIRRNPGAA